MFDFGLAALRLPLVISAALSVANEHPVVLFVVGGDAVVDRCSTNAIGLMAITHSIGRRATGLTMRARVSHEGDDDCKRDESIK